MGVWVIKDKKWKQREKQKAIGRIHFASPKAGEQFYLHVLLTVVRGPRSFEDLRTHEQRLLPTFKDACHARGLLESDEEWKLCLRDAVAMQMGYSVRQLFATILIHCNPTSPHLLWEEFKVQICDDIPRRPDRRRWPEERICDYGLYDLNKILKKSGKSLADFPPMPLPVEDWEAEAENSLLAEQLNYNAEEESRLSEENRAKFNEGQCGVHDEIVAAALGNSHQKMIFVNGSGGTGKSFCWNTITHS